MFALFFYLRTSPNSVPNKSLDASSYQSNSFLPSDLHYDHYKRLREHERFKWIRLHIKMKPSMYPVCEWLYSYPARFPHCKPLFSISSHMSSFFVLLCLPRFCRLVVTQFKNVLGQRSYEAFAPRGHGYFKWGGSSLTIFKTVVSTLNCIPW